MDAGAILSFFSATFLTLFLPGLLAAYAISSMALARWRIRMPVLNSLLFAASLGFYAWGEVFQTAVLIVSLLANYCFGRIAARWLKFGSWLAIAFNLSVLIWFKYAEFAANSWLELRGLPVNTSAATTAHLPLGLSFFTFQAISYVLDVARKTVPVERSILRYGLSVLLFPHLLAGPIVRYADIAGPLRERRFDPAQFADGTWRFAIGLAKKLILANTFSTVADAAFGMTPDRLSAGAAWLGAVCYALQIYFDFGGYSCMAIGLAKMFGFDFPENFRHPYIARSVGDFWRRWHISLGSWFRDYLYIPLGGNRASPVRTSLNLLVVFGLCGLWHGANWTFLIWGLYHGGWLVAERLGLESAMKKLWVPLQHAATLAIVLVGWVLFRATGFAAFLGYLGAMLGLSGQPEIETIDLASNRLWLLLPIGALACLPIRSWLQSQPFERWKPIWPWLRTAAVPLLIIAALSQAVAGTHAPFIYFRF